MSTSGSSAPSRPPAPERPGAPDAAPARRLPLKPAGPDRPRGVTFRSALLGTAAVMLVAGVTPYNDYVVANTFFVGSYFPLSVVLSFFLLIVAVNGPLNRFAPRAAFSTGELAVVLAMMLMACCIPSQGLMRQFLPMIVAPFYYASDARFWQNFTTLDLPTWLFPVTDMTGTGTSPIAQDFFGRVQPGDPKPYGAWVAPLVGWGVFIGAMWAALVAMASLLRPQWATNERLPFPLARLQLALIESPAPRRWLNDLLGARTFWIALATVFCLHAFNGLHVYFPRTVPELPLDYDLTGVFSEQPWVYLSGGIKRSFVYFTFIGLTYFIQSKVSFSLWSVFLIIQAFIVHERTYQREITGAAWNDQHVGASIAFAGGVLWVGRHHLMRVARDTLGIGAGRQGASTPTARRDHRTAVLFLVGGTAVMMVWLAYVGVSFWIAAGTVGSILLAHLVIARIVAETGVPFMRSYLAFTSIYTNFPPASMTGRDVVMAGLIHSFGPHSTRESTATFAMHGLQVHADTEPPRNERRKLFALLAWALALGYVVAAMSSLWCYYSYATPIAPKLDHVLNPEAATYWPRDFVMDPLNRWTDGRFPPKTHNPWLHMAVGCVVTTGLYVASLRWVAWPFAPIGYLVSSTWYIQMGWFSIFLGWLCKVLIVRFGGADLYRRARPFFVGLIFGEAIAAGFWMALTLVLAQMGVEYEAIRLLPT